MNTLLSQTAEYALRIMIFLTERKDESVTAAQISKATRVPVGYTVKVLQQLSRAKFVEGQRGRTGGFVLDCDPAQILLLQIVTAIDPLERITSCPLDRADHKNGLCPLHKQIDCAIGGLRKTLSSMSLHDVVKSSVGLTLCQDKLVE
jgi:Rrf2 family protein